MRRIYEVFGMKNDTSKMEGEMSQFQVNVTIDDIGATISIGDLKSGIQYSIPFDMMLRDIKKELKERRFK